MDFADLQYQGERHCKWSQERQKPHILLPTCFIQSRVKRWLHREEQEDKLTCLRLRIHQVHLIFEQLVIEVIRLNEWTVRIDESKYLDDLVEYLLVLHFDEKGPPSRMWSWPSYDIHLSLKEMPYANE